MSLLTYMGRQVGSWAPEGVVAGESVLLSSTLTIAKLHPRLSAEELQKRDLTIRSNTT